MKEWVYAHFTNLRLTDLLYFGLILVVGVLAAWAFGAWVHQSIQRQAEEDERLEELKRNDDRSFTERLVGVPYRPKKPSAK